MIDKRRGTGRHDALLELLPPEDEGGGWMISYVDVMTLLVVLLVLIIALGRAGDRPALDDSGAAVEGVRPLALVRGSAPLGVPLPDSLRELLGKSMAASAALSAGNRPGINAHKSASTLAPRAVSAALGVAGLPARRRLPWRVMPRSTPPALLARAKLPRVEAPASAIPQPVLASGIDLSAPLADYLLVLTDRPLPGVEKVSLEAIGAAEVVARAWREAPYMPDLEGVEVSRIPEGVRLRVEDHLLFPTAEAQLTDAGLALVAGRLRELVERHPGEVAVEGHSDSRPISTERFPSNWALSSARAIAIVEALVSAGIAPDRLRAVGLADTRPLADNHSAEGRARNRRVEVTIQAR